MSRNYQLKITLPQDQLETLTIESQRTGTSRSALLRQWAFGPSKTPPAAPARPTKPSSLPQGPQVYANAVEAAARAYPGLPRAQMEAIVSAVIVSLNNG